MDSRFDVAVLGGGPAGSAAALLLARSGVSVVLLERSRYDTDRIGETVLPEIQIPLQTLGTWEFFKRARHRPIGGISSVWGSAQRSESDFIFSPYGHGWVLDRRRFDAMLAEAATASGANVKCCSHVVSCETQPNHNWIVRFRSYNKESAVNVRFVLNATGRAGAISGLISSRIYGDKSIGMIKRLRGGGEMCDGERTLVEASKDGWWYSTWLPNNELLVVYMTDLIEYARAVGQHERVWTEGLTLAPHTFARVVQCAASSKIRTVHSGCSRSQRGGGDRWLSIGDAALAFDPLCGQGILRALHSGIFGARVVMRGLNEGVLNTVGMDSTRAFSQHLALRSAYYRVEQRWQDSLFWIRRSVAPQP